MTRKQDGVKFGGRFTVECYGPDGKLKWRDTFHNLVVTEGLNYLLDAGLLGGAQVTTWYIGLTGSSPTPAAGDTMASHAGWTEFTSYSEAARPAFSGTRTNQTVSNSASKATFSINASGTAGGAFMVSDSTKGGTTGTLLCVGPFSQGDKAVSNGDTLNVQYDFQALDDGV